jgi:D-glucosaminate-6-phosphate ammonia-lyase
MFTRFVRKFKSSRQGVSRRDLLRTGTVAGVVGSMPSAAVAASTRGAIAAAEPSDMKAASDALYKSIGVSPVVNARGTFTIITGSQSLPEVKLAMNEASRNFVQMDELMDGASKRLAEVTGAPWGIVTAGCCAALTNFTAACIAGTNPERMQRLPNLTGLKNEVIIPEYSRNVYDHAIRMLGVKIIEVKTPEELESVFNERTALIYILAGPGDEGPLGTEAVSKAARAHNVPVIVDAAAENLTIPNLHLGRGATAVAYSGGKCIRGPQAAGLLLGDKNLLEAAWANSAPHHAFGRSLKVGKEEIMGMLAAVEAWPKRNHEAEWQDWNAQLRRISDRVTKISGVSSRVSNPDSLSNRTPTLHIEWDATQLGITGQEVTKLLLDTEPRIVLSGGTGVRPDRMKSSVSVTPWMMMPGDDRIVAERISWALTNHPRYENPPVPEGPLATVAGQWQATLTFAQGSAQHTLVFEQQEDHLLGTHHGEFVAGDLTGSVTANQVHFRSSQKIEGQLLSYEFAGTVDGNKMSGTVNLGEYGMATWAAERHHYAAPYGTPRGVKKG